MSEEDNKLKVLVCQRCTNYDLFSQLEAAVNSNLLLPVIIEKIGCLGGCLGDRIDVHFPSKEIVSYGKFPFECDEIKIYAIGSEPIKTILADNILKLKNKG